MRALGGSDPPSPMDRARDAHLKKVAVARKYYYYVCICVCVCVASSCIVEYGKESFLYI